MTWAHGSKECSFEHNGESLSLVVGGSPCWVNSHSYAIMNIQPAAVDLLGVNANFVDLTGVDSDEDINHNNEHEHFWCAINGKPCAQGRPRKYRTVFVNPNTKQSKAFKEHLMFAMESYTPGVLFEKGTPVEVDIGFFLPRPKQHFKGGRRCLEAMKKWAFESTTAAVGPDVDNMAKFVLDAMNGIVYDDDRQVVHLTAHKHRDNNAPFEGCTVISVRMHSDDGVITDNFGELL